MKLSKETVEHYINLKKIVQSTLKWQAKPNNPSMFVESNLFEEDQITTIGGLTMHLEMGTSPKIKGRCRWEFSLFAFVQGRKQRIYQLHVSPPDKRTHNSKTGAIFGPHEHYGEYETKAVIDGNINCTNFEYAFKIFCERTNITFLGTFEQGLSL